MKTLLYKTNNPDSRSKLNDYLNYLDDCDKDSQIEQIINIKKNKPVRSTDANARYWVLLTFFATHCGHTKEELHEYYKKKFNGKDVLGERIGLTTTDMDSTEFHIYYTSVKEDGKREFNIKYIPEPEDRSYAVWEQITKDKYNAMIAAA